jgi:PTH2 family peptidyl-tRNA hydrolase
MFKQVIVVRKDLKLSKGKLAGQACHAAIAAYKAALERAPEKVLRWELEGSKKAVLAAADEGELRELYASVPKKIPKGELIHDAGRTHLEPGTLTCFALGPWDEEEIDRVTGHLKLVN